MRGLDPRIHDELPHLTLSVHTLAGLDLGTVDETIIAGAGVTPLPAALPLFASGLGVLGFIARRKKKRKKKKKSAASA
jgi:F420-0:gamma-glutamyl ligase-like protein